MRAGLVTLTLLNGLMIMLAALGAVTATLPAELLLVYISWRGLFELLAAVTAGCGHDLSGRARGRIGRTRLEWRGRWRLEGGLH